MVWFRLPASRHHHPLLRFGVGWARGVPSSRPALPSRSGSGPLPGGRGSAEIHRLRRSERSSRQTRKPRGQSTAQPTRSLRHSWRRRKRHQQRLPFIVLPFANLSNNPDQEYFADGITEGLTADLSRIPGSLVVARNTAFSYKATPSMRSRSLVSWMFVMSSPAGVRRDDEGVRLNAADDRCPDGYDVLDGAVPYRSCRVRRGS